MCGDQSRCRFRVPEFQPLNYRLAIFWAVAGADVITTPALKNAVARRMSVTDAAAAPVVWCRHGMLESLHCYGRGWRLSLFFSPGRWSRRLSRRLAMATHKFRVGQIVFLEAARHLNLPGGAHIITRKMPEHDGEFEYRVKNINEPHERVVRESQMRILVE